MIILIINNKLGQTIIGIKHEYNTTNSTFTFGSCGRNNKTHYLSFAGDRYYSYQDLKEIKKVKLNSGNFKEVALHWSNEFLKFTVKALKQKST